MNKILKRAHRKESGISLRNFARKLDAIPRLEGPGSFVKFVDENLKQLIIAARLWLRRK